MNKHIDDLLYHSGLTAQGCWDELGTYEQEAIEKFAELIVRKCAETVQDFVDHRFPASEYPVRLRRYFGVEK
jgi:hypothetical protein